MTGSTGTSRACRSGGTMQLASLDDRVEVHRDEWGIPHVKARTSHDAFFAQGIVHAEDRLWQMDLARRRMQGRWSEWIGSAGLAADTLARRMGTHTAGKRDYLALGAPARGMLDAYAG